jgi:hypothetical protein
MRAEKSESEIAEHHKMSIPGNFKDSVEKRRKKEEKTASKPWFMTMVFGFTSFKPEPKPAGNHGHGLVWFQQTMVLVCWFLGLKPNQADH